MTANRVTYPNARSRSTSAWGTRRRIDSIVRVLFRLGAREETLIYDWTGSRRIKHCARTGRDFFESGLCAARTAQFWYAATEP